MKGSARKRGTVEGAGARVNEWHREARTQKRERREKTRGAREWVREAVWRLKGRVRGREEGTCLEIFS